MILEEVGFTSRKIPIVGFKVKHVVFLWTGNFEIDIRNANLFLAA